jgi:hypothetical protein
VDVDLDGPFDSDQTLIVSADLNFDGTYQPAEVTTKIIRKREDGQGVAVLLVLDDGIWPGNATSSDQLRVKVDFAGDSLAKNMKVKNVRPAIVGIPFTNLVTEPDGSQYHQAFVSFVDPGVMDRFNDSYIAWGGWGDYINTRPFVVTQAASECYGNVWTAEFRVNPAIYPGASLYPDLISISDDDLGSDNFSTSQLGLVVNNDDDNWNQIEDLHDFGFTDDDLKSVSGISPGTFSTQEGRYYLSYNSSVIRVWDSQAKNFLIPPGDTHIDGFFSIDYTGQNTIWVEGVSPGNSDIYAYWKPNVACSNGLVGNLVKVTVLGIDVDVDSDNDGLIEHDDWEEELESHPFALGKLLFWERPGQSQDETLVEIKVQLPVGLPPSSLVTIVGKTIHGSTGTVEVLKQNKQHLGMTSFQGNLGTLSLGDLSYNPSSGSFSLFLRRPIAVTTPPTKKDADVAGKPDARLSIEVRLPNGPTVKDEVKLLIVRERDFFHMVHLMPQLRQAGASQAVYGGGTGSGGTMHLSDGKNFTMRYIPIEEMQKILENETFSALPADLKGFARSYILSHLYNYRPNGVDPEKPASFQAGLYRNYVTGGYSLAIRGTELNSIPETINDWLTNLYQGLTGDDPSYEAGILLTWALKSMDFMSCKEFRLTGHSMGGGIASAASVTNSVPAEVFNSAGVHPNSLVQDNGDPIIPGTNPSMGDAASLITHYYIANNVDGSLQGQFNQPDVLTFLSTHVRAMPKPPGTLIEIEGFHNQNYPDYIVDGIVELGELPEDPSNLTVWTTILAGLNLGHYFGSDLGEMIQSHGMEHIFFGLLHHDDKDDRWNAYDKNDPRPY